MDAKSYEIVSHTPFADTPPKRSRVRPLHLIIYQLHNFNLIIVK